MVSYVYYQYVHADTFLREEEGGPLIWYKLAHVHVLVEPISFFAKTLSNKNASLTERIHTQILTNFNQEQTYFSILQKSNDKEILTKFKDPPNHNPCSQGKMNTCNEV